MFLAAYDGDGNQTWLTQFGTDQSDGANGVAPDEANGLFVAGRTYGALDGLNLGGEDVYLARFSPPCYADINGNGTLDLFDFLWFVNLFNAADPDADCDGNGDLDLFDFLCFTNAFNAGC